jgi:hypothetical protein
LLQIVLWQHVADSPGKNEGEDNKRNDLKIAQLVLLIVQPVLFTDYAMLD